MCGIYGQISTSPALNGCGLAIRHRGPDDAGAEVFSIPGTNLSLTLVHRRLSIIDLSPAGHQPMANEDNTVWITFNGEIYNFHSLRSELLAAGHVFRSKTDTETIIHGYEEWGEEVVHRLHGMFALAIWDTRKRRLLLARDRVGKKPLFYYADERKFFFGSEIKALLASGEVPATPDPVALHDYLTYLYFPAPRTAFERIRKLPPATILTLEIGTGGKFTQRHRTFWDPFEAAGSAHDLSERQAIERTRELMDEAVRSRLMSDVPLGVFLSEDSIQGRLRPSLLRIVRRRSRPSALGSATANSSTKSRWRMKSLAGSGPTTGFCMLMRDVQSTSLLWSATSMSRLAIRPRSWSICSPSTCGST